jgi:hypothetical protein
MHTSLQDQLRVNTSQRSLHRLYHAGVLCLLQLPLDSIVVLNTKTFFPGHHIQFIKPVVASAEKPRGCLSLPLPAPKATSAPFREGRRAGVGGVEIAARGSGRQLAGSDTRDSIL